MAEPATFCSFTDFTTRIFRRIDHAMFWKLGHWLGRGDNSSEHDGDSGDFDETHEIVEELVVAGCYSSELFELVEKSFDQVALEICLKVGDGI